MQANRLQLPDALLFLCQRRARVAPQAWIAPGDDAGHRNGGEAAADDGEGDAKERGDEAGFEFAQLRAAHEENLIDAGHTSAQTVGRHDLADRLADDGRNGVAGADEHEEQVSV